MVSFICCKPLAKLNGEPIKNLSGGNEADPKTKSADSAKTRDEVHPSHLL